ncbi:MAG: DinB family protein [Flavobacterium sp.]|nr:DinB family protein [Flavobacterium sp.]
MADKDKRRAVEALLSEYRNVVVALQKVIANVSYANLTTVVDSTTTDANCQSIQTILTHVVSSGYSYAGYIRKLKKIADNRPGKVSKMSAADYLTDLDDLIAYTVATFETISDHELEEFDEDKKIKTSWGQVYDIEQMMEHAVVHVLRHRRQIEKFKKKMEVL